jgi:hypothetical protein
MKGVWERLWKAYVGCVNQSICGFAVELKELQNRSGLVMVVDFWVVPALSKDKHSFLEGGVGGEAVSESGCGHEGVIAYCRPPWWRRIGLSGGSYKP